MQIFCYTDYTISPYKPNLTVSSLKNGLKNSQQLHIINDDKICIAADSQTKINVGVDDNIR